MTYIPFGSAIAVGLPETGTHSLFGLTAKFWCMLISASVAGAGGLLAFLSSSFGKFQQEKSDTDIFKKAYSPPK